MLPALKALPGFKDVVRIVCGDCQDFQVVTALDAGKYGDWASSAFAPEEDFLNKLRAIPGISQVETQTYTREFM